jgi:predicted MPP superfamily phosphohydrolase
MNRRIFLGRTGWIAMGFPFISLESSTGRNEISEFRESFSQEGNQVSLFTKAQVASTRMFHITDTHLSLDDERGLPYRTFSKRMAGAYRSNRHFQTGEMYTAEESFEQTLQLAKEQEVDFLALTGDIFSFPSQAAVEWTLHKLEDSGIPFAYVAGNHDWHFEGMPGSSSQLRDEWTGKHLSPLYQGNHPLYASYDLNGVRLVCIDNSTYEITPEQLAFFRKQTELDIPVILFMHIPLYVPGRSMGYGCAHPEWGAGTDKGYEIERREKSPAGGHSELTFAFRDLVFKAPNLLAVLAGHTHQAALDVKNGIPQIVSGPNAQAYYTSINIRSV